MDSMLFLSLPLPPPWRQEVVEDEVLYVNEVTGQATSKHPFHIYLSFKNMEHNDAYDQEGERGQESLENTGPGAAQEGSADNDQGHPPEGEKEAEAGPNGAQESYEAKFEKSQRPAEADQIFAVAHSTRPGSRASSGGAHFDYHCQWSERDVFGKVTLYGLTLRMSPDEVGRTLIKFDGMDGQWEYAALKGPYGSLELHDLYIGAKIVIFGRHLTIGSANSAACEWIDRERRRLEKQQEEFRRKIQSLGNVPVVRKVEAKSVQHITRDSKTKGHVNLRNMMKDNAKLGEQLAALGLASRAM